MTAVIVTFVLVVVFAAAIWVVLAGTGRRDAAAEEFTRPVESAWAGCHDMWLRLADHAEQRGDSKHAAELRRNAEAAADRARNHTRTTT